LFTTFDAEIARVYGVRTSWVDAGFALALAATIVASMNIVGVTLIAAAIVVPPSTARLVTKSFGRMVIISTLLGASLGFAGMFLSFEYDIASGAAIVLLGTVVFMTVYSITGARAWLQHRRRFAVKTGVSVSADRPRTQGAPAGFVVTEEHSV
jgi:manganese/iron transport system permease protein/iron/zinc/copper transport system permease protein